MNANSGAPPEQVDYKGRDLNLRVLVYVGIGLLLLVVMGLVANRILFDVFRARDARRDRPVSLFDDVRADIPQPVLQVNPGADREQLESEMRQLLGSYEWVDPERGLVRIPIERAMELAADEGLPEFSEDGLPEFPETSGGEDQ